MINTIFKQVLSLIVVVTAFYFIIVFIGSSCFRIAYPYELEWMEGGMIDHILRVMAGQNLYVEPSIDFVPFIYPPFYFYISALVSGLIGEGFAAARFISLLATIGNFLLLYFIVVRETKSPFVGITTAGLFAATYEASGAWFDLARVDPLFLCLYLAAVYLIRFKPTAKYLVLSGILLTLSYLTKQTALAMIAPLLLFSVCKFRSQSLWIILSTIAGVTITTGLLNYFSDGWYYFYVFDVPGQHSWLPSMFTDFWLHDLIGVVPILMFFALLFIFKPKPDASTDNRLLYCVVLFSLIGAAWLGRLHTGGYVNVLMTAHIALALLTGLGLWTLFSLVKEKLLIHNLALVTILVQFWMLSYPALKYIPSDLDRQAYDSFVDAVREVEGDVFIPYHGYIGRLAGKRTFCHKMAVGDITRADSTVGKALTNEIEKAYRDKFFSAVILDAGWSTEKLKLHYTNTGGVFTDLNAGYPMTGLRTRPRYFFVPRKPLGF